MIAYKITACLLFIAAAPAFAGLIQKIKALLVGKVGPPVIQPYRDLRRLLQKETIYAGTSSLISRVAPVVVLWCTILCAALVPMGIGESLVSFEGDVILFAYLLGLARFFQILAAMDGGSAFGGMGAAREASFSVFAEPVYFFSIGSLAFITGHMSLSKVFASVDFFRIDSLIFAVVCSLSIFILMVAECSRMPVDDPTTHLELTMIHEVMVLESSGVDLALHQFASYVKLFLFVSLEASLFNPFRSQNVWTAALIFLGSALALAFTVAYLESMFARFRLKNIPQYLLFAASIGILNLILYGLA